MTIIHVKQYFSQALKVPFRFLVNIRVGKTVSFWAYEQIRGYNSITFTPHFCLYKGKHLVQLLWYQKYFISSFICISC